MEDKVDNKVDNIVEKKKVVDNDKRKQTSKSNLAKARQAKIQQLKKVKEDKEKKAKEEVFQSNDSESDSESSESDENVIVIGKKKTVKKNSPTPLPQNDSLKDEVDKLRAQIEKLTIKKKKPSKSRQVIKIVNPPPVIPTKDTEMEKYRRILLSQFK